MNKRLTILILLLAWLFNVSNVSGQQPTLCINADSLHHTRFGYPLQKQQWRISRDSSGKSNVSFGHINFGLSDQPSDWKGHAWFSLSFTADQKLRGQALAMRINHDGASLIYLDDRLVGRVGTIGAGNQLLEPRRAPWQLIPFTINDEKPHKLKILYANDRAYFSDFIGFQIWMDTYANMSAGTLQRVQYNDELLLSVGAQFALVLLHLFFFIFYPRQRLNLYYCLFVSCCALTIWLRYFGASTIFPDRQLLADQVFEIAIVAGTYFAAILLYGVSIPNSPVSASFSWAL